MNTSLATDVIEQQYRSLTWDWWEALPSLAQPTIHTDAAM